MLINGETFTTFEDLWESSNLTQIEKEAIELETKLIGRLIEARERNRQAKELHTKARKDVYQ